MSEEEAPEPEAPAGTDDDEVNALLFGKWETTDIHYEDPSTRRYLAVTPVAHTMGRHSQKQFKKSELSVVERLANRLMKTSSNAGKKQQSLQIVRDAFDIVHERTDENPIQVLVSAVENAAPREETVRLKYGGISVPQAVDTAPQCRVDQALKFRADELVRQRLGGRLQRPDVRHRSERGEGTRRGRGPLTSVSQFLSSIQFYRATAPAVW